MRINRRQFLATGAGVLAAPSIVTAQAKPNVAIIGGGAGGATAARLLAQAGVKVSLVEPSKQYTSCFYSNLFLGGFRTFSSITHSYDQLVTEYGVERHTERAVSVNRTAQTVALAGGTTVPYDRLLMAPGIGFVWDSVPGYSKASAETAPHGWQGGRQTSLLRARINALEDGQNVVIVPPENPYRCPPGPYERASMIAHVLKSRGFRNSRITIIDPKKSFSKQALFTRAWQQFYPGMIEWFGPDVHGGISLVNVPGGTVETALGSFDGSLLNIIPGQRAGRIAAIAELTDSTGFCPVAADSMRSTSDDRIFVVGDASIAGDMPKSGFSANSQAKVAVTHILHELLARPLTDANYGNTCWSLLAPRNSVKVGAAYRPVDGRITAFEKFVSQPQDSLALRQENFEDSAAWYDGMIADMFG